MNRVKSGITKILSVAAVSCGLSAFAGLPITDAQKEYLTNDVIAIVHWGLNTFTGQEWGDGTTAISTFPTTIGDTINPSQWVSAMKAGGIKKVILVAKHHDGFCLWPATETDNNGYSTAALPEGHSFKDYNLIQQVHDACVAQGVNFGVYISPWDRHHADWGHDDGKYTTYFHSQVKHIIDTYGPITEMWFDGATGDTGYYGGANESRSLPSAAKTYYDFDTIRAYLNASNPNAVIFGGGCSNAVCWAGNELGNVPTEGGWVYDKGSYFGSPECDTPMGGSSTSAKGAWFWHSDHVPKSLKQMVNNYFQSVGRGGVLNWGVSPDQTGVIPAADVARLKEFGDYVKALNASDLFKSATETTETTSTSVTKTLTLASSKTFNVVDFGENLDAGEKVTSWKVEALVDDTWTTLETGVRPGYRRMVRTSADVTATAVRITATGATTPMIERIHVRKAATVADDGSVDMGGTDTEEWMEKDAEGYHNVSFVGATPKFSLPTDMTTYEIEITLTNVTDKSSLSVSGYPQIVSLTGASGDSLALSVAATDGYGLFLTSSSVTGTTEGTLIGTYRTNTDAGTTAYWTTTTGGMKLTIRNDGERIFVYKDGELILETDKNFSNHGKVTSVSVCSGLSTLGGEVLSIRYRTAQDTPVADILKGAYLWLDASDADSILTNDSGAVTNWCSQNVGGMVATNYTSMTGPSVVANALNGKAVVDFGSANSGKDLAYTKTSGIRTVFMVADIEQSQAVFFLGDHSNGNSGTYDFHRGANGNYIASGNAPKFVNGVYRDGVKIADPGSTLLPTGYGLLTLVASSGATACNLGRDRSISGRNGGGKKIAEVLIFNKVLTARERSQVEEYLMKKWLGTTFYTATVSGTQNFADLTWSPSTPTSFSADNTVTKLIAGTAAKVNFAEAVTIGTLKLDGTYDEMLTLANYTNLTATTWEVKETPGFALDATDGATPTTTWKNFLRTFADCPITIKGSGESGIALDYITLDSGAASSAFAGHLIFDGGTHSFSYQRDSSNNAEKDFAVGASADNPNILVQSGTVLNFTGHDLSGWRGSANTNAIIEVATGGCLNCLQDGSSTFYYRQRLTINPGAVVSVKMDNYSSSNDSFRLEGGTAESTAQIYVPSSSTTTDPAVIYPVNTDKCSIRLHSDTTHGLAIKVETGSTLDISNAITSAQADAPIVKYGAGTLRLTGSLSSYTGTNTVSAGTLALSGSAATSLKNLILNSGTTIRPAAGTTISDYFSGANFTLDATDLIANAADGATEITALTIPSGSTFATVGLTNAAGWMLKVESNTLKLVPDVGEIKVSSLAAGSYYVLNGATTLNFDKTPSWTTGTAKITLNGVLTLTGRVDVTPELLNKFTISGATSTVCAWTTREVISINFGNAGAMSGDSSDGSLAGLVYGSSWNNCTAGTSTGTGLQCYWTGSEKKTDLTGLTAAWTANSSPWSKDAYVSTFQKGYLDDGASTAVKITLTGIPFAQYDAIIYFASDTAYATDSKANRFQTPQVNGKYYTCDGTTGIASEASASGSWGKSYDQVATTKFGANAIRITGLSGNLGITNAVKSSNIRGTVAALQIINTTPFVDFTAEVSSETATWSTKTGLTTSDTWANNPTNTITLFDTAADAATLTFDEAVTARTVTVYSEAGKVLTLAKGTDVDVAAGTFDFSGAEGTVTNAFATGTAAVLAGADTVLTELGTGTIAVDAGCKLTLVGAARDWATASITVAAGGELVIGGGDMMTTVPYSAKGTTYSSVAGTLSYACEATKVDAEGTEYKDSGMQFNGSVTRNIYEGAKLSAQRFVNGNGGSSVQTFNQYGGVIDVTGTGDITDSSPTDTAPLLFAHWSSTVAYNLLGGSLIATNGVKGSVYFSRDGQTTLSIGGGENTATLKTNGLIDDDRRLKARDQTGITLLANGRFEIGSFGLNLYDDREYFKLSGGALVAYEDAAVALSNNTIQVTAASTLAAAAGKTLTIAAPLSGTGDLTIGTDTEMGTVVLTNAATTLSGTITITSGATLALPMVTDDLSFTVSGAGTLRVLLTEAQKENIATVVTGIKTSNFTGTITLVDGAGTTITHQTASTTTEGKVQVALSDTYKLLTWDNTNKMWIDASGTEQTVDTSSALLLHADDSITLSATISPWKVQMPDEGTVAIEGYKNLDVSTLSIPADAALRLVVSHNSSIGEDKVKSTLAFTGAGNVECYCSYSSPWVTGLPVADANFADDFTGRLVIAKGQYKATEVIKAAVTIQVVDGGNLHISTGTWTNHFVLSGDGWQMGSGWDTCSLRLNGGSVGDAAVLEFVTDENGKKGSIGCYNTDATTIGCTLKGDDGFIIKSGTITFKTTTTTTDLKGTVELAGGTCTFGQGGTSAAEAGTTIKLGDKVQVDKDTTFTLWLWQGQGGLNNTTSTKVTFGSDIDLNGGTWVSDDGGYVYSGAITVVADSTFKLHYTKGRVLQNLNIPAGKTLEIHRNSGDTSTTPLFVTGGTIAGTIKTSNDTTYAIWLIPLADTFANATVNMGGSDCLAIQTANTSIGNLQGSGKVFTDCLIGGTTITVGGGSYAGVLQNTQSGGTSHPLNLKITGDLTLTGANTTTGAFTLNAGTLTVPSTATVPSTVTTDIAGKVVTETASGDNTVYALGEASDDNPLQPLPDGATNEVHSVSTAGITVEPGILLKVPANTSKDLIKVKYGDTMLKGGTGTQYVTAEVGTDGMVTLSPTDAAKPSPTAMAAGSDEDAGKITVDIGTPIPGLFYEILTSTDGTNFKSSTAEGDGAKQATSTATHTVSVTPPTDSGGKTPRVTYYKLAVKATK